MKYYISSSYSIHTLHLGNIYLFNIYVNTMNISLNTPPCLKPGCREMYRAIRKIVLSLFSPKVRIDGGLILSLKIPGTELYNSLLSRLPHWDGDDDTD